MASMLASHQAEPQGSPVMQAIRFHNTGSPAEVLQLDPLELPPLAEGEVRLKILAAPINPADLNLIQGNYGVKAELPAIPGIEGCGEVIESRSNDFSIGDRAIFLRRAGTWASHTQMPASAMWKIPSGIDPLQAAMLKVNPATAWRLLKGFRELPAGSWVAQNAGNSGVGRSLIQLARQLGLRTVNFVRRAELIDELLALGADEVFLDDDDGIAQAKTLLHGKEAPCLAANAVGGDSALRLMSLLAPGGTHVTYGAMALRPLKVPNGMLIFKDLEIRGLWVTRWLESASDEEIDRTYTALAGFVQSGKLHVPVDLTCPLKDFPQAIARAMASGRAGKVLFVP
jgi:mitochondrial enoyl-[acyl-carrier protein] reductase / trans-2-enoyl-CoA reductase